MSETQIEEALQAFESDFGPVSEAQDFVAATKSGSCGVCDAYKCQMVD